MAKKQEDVQAFPENYAQVRAKIIDGTVSQQELSNLYDHYAAIKGFTQKANGIGSLIDDLHKNEPKITADNYHDLASKLVEVEKAKVMEAVPVNEAEPDKELTNKSRRTAEFFRNTSLSKLVVLDESKRNNFCRDIYEDIAAGQNDVAKQKLSALEVPSFLKDHYSSIKEFYKENGKEIGAARNMVFHIISTSITSFAEEASRSTGGNERNDVPKAAKGLLEEVYGRGNDPKLQPLMDKISGKGGPAAPKMGVEKTGEPIISEQPQPQKKVIFDLPKNTIHEGPSHESPSTPSSKAESVEKPQKKGFVEWFVEKVKNLLGKKDNSMPVEKTTGATQEQNVPSTRKRGAEVVERPELVGPALKPRELQPVRKRANAMDKARAEEIGKIAKSTQPKPKLEGQKQQAKQRVQDSGMARK